MRTIQWTEYDRLVYTQEIGPFLPKRIFDAHCHLIHNVHHPDLAKDMPMACDPLLGEVDRPYVEQWWRALFPEARVTGLLMGMPTAHGDWRSENEFVAENARGSECPFSLLTHPAASAGELEADVMRLRPAGLKPYMCFVQGKPPEDAAITDMIPESQLAVADAHGLAVTLHVARARGMADPDNLTDIARLTRDFPRCRFILAHCGRCFITPNMEAALEHLPVAENLWLDTSAVCDMGVFLHVFRRYDRTRLLFGTDLVTATGFKGSYVRLGLSWHVCTAEMVSGLKVKATFAAYENLCALLHAARFCGLDEFARQDLFFGNAKRLFGLGD